MKSSHKNLKTKGLRGFTLVELLTVVTIIVILSGMVVGVSSFVQRKAAVEKARVQMELFNLKINEPVKAQFERIRLDIHVGVIGQHTTLYPAD